MQIYMGPLIFNLIMYIKCVMEFNIFVYICFYRLLSVHNVLKLSFSRDGSKIERHRCRFPDGREVNMSF